MQVLRGKGVSGGVAIGRARLLKKRAVDVSERSVEDVAAEWRRYERAREAAVRELDGLYERGVRSVGQQEADIFGMHAMIARDEDLNEAVRQGILGRRVNAEHALFCAAEEHAAVFSHMDDAYMRERAADVKDVADRILRHLSGMADGGAAGEGEALDGAGDIICAEDLSPAQTLLLDRHAVSAFVTARGSTNSHTAILSRTMNLPAVVAVGEALDTICDGMLLAVDADAGEIHVEPDATTLERLRLRLEQSKRSRELLERYRGRESRTLDGVRVEICANVGSMADVEEALRNDAEGIGLFRSEFLYMGRDALPSEEEQLAIYRRVLRAMPGKRVVVRTLDVGADKQASALALPHEENPALGLRAVRVSLRYPDVFMTQARALLRASLDGRLCVMFPLITSEREVLELKQMWQRAERELRAQGIPFSPHVELGIMIETPAAALISDRLAPLVDFFSIGTNDLTQYTLALDRQNEALEGFCDIHHEAVLRLLRHTVKEARQAGIWVGICGELGADLSLTETFLRMGVDEISVTPPAVLALRERVCTLRVGERTRSVRL